MRSPDDQISLNVEMPAGTGSLRSKALWPCVHEGDSADLRAAQKGYVALGLETYAPLGPLVAQCDD